jgi:hypothetical protein
MAEIEQVTSVYHEKVALYQEGKVNYQQQAMHGMTTEEATKKLNESIVGTFLAKLSDYVPAFTAVRINRNKNVDGGGETDTGNNDNVKWY